MIQKLLWLPIIDSYLFFNFLIKRMKWPDNGPKFGFGPVCSINAPKFTTIIIKIFETTNQNQVSKWIKIQISYLTRNITKIFNGIVMWM